MSGVELADAIARARAGSSEAWGEIYRRYAGPLFRFCRRVMPTREDAEDATMDIFVKLRGKLDQYNPERPFQAWLYKVASNHCWDILRRRHVQQDLEIGDVENMPLEHPDPGQLDALVAAQSGERVRQALERLPVRARMVLVLRYYVEMTYDEIAEALGLRRAFVGVVLLRARHQLRDLLSKGSAEPPEVAGARRGAR